MSSQPILNKSDEKWRIHLKDIFKTIRSLAIDNIEYFQYGKHTYQARFHMSFCLLHEHIDLGIEPLTDDLIQRIWIYDLSPSVPGNGYRSLIKIIEHCCLYLLQLSRHISVTRSSLFFRSSFYSKELESYVATLRQLRACLYYAERLISFCDSGNLFPEENNLPGHLAEQLLMEVELLKQNSFYGRCLGFQFCESMQKPLQMVLVAMASFSEGYRENSGVMQFATSILNSGKYLVSPEMRAAQIVNVTKNADIDFCKAFWSITETDFMHRVPAIVCPVVQVDELISLPPVPVEVRGSKGQSITIQPPTAHTGPAAFNVRLISYEFRDGQDPKMHRKLGRRKTQPASPYLLIHCHGGGFVAQSSKSHEVYLKHWAKDLNVPILSIDYSLAPENPFPRATEECFYAYAWALNNFSKLGTTGEKICFAGDSAGGNLMIATTLRAISEGLPVPDGLMCAYTPVMIRYTPSPSRLLTTMDPLLPVGILTRCLAAYAGVTDSLTAETQLSSTPKSSTNKKFPTSDRDVRLKADEISLDTGFGSTDSLVREKTSENDLVLLDDPYGIRRSLVTDDVSLDSISGDSEASQCSQVTFSLTTGADHLSKTTRNNIGQGSFVSNDNFIGIDDLHLECNQNRGNSERGKLNTNQNGHQTDNGDYNADSHMTDPLNITSNTNGNVVDCLNTTNNSEGHMINHTNTTNKGNGHMIDHMNMTNNNQGLNTTNNNQSSHKSTNSNVNKDRFDKTICNSVQSCDNNDINGKLAGSDVTRFSNNGKDIFSRASWSRHREFSLELSIAKSPEQSETAIPTVNRRMPRGHSANDLCRPMSRLGVMTDTLTSPIFEDNHPVSMSNARHLFRRLSVVENPYMSPILAPDDLLSQMPPTFLVACHLDPILDDSVMFAKKLRGLGATVHLHLIDGLPHGFLNFTLVSKDAKAAGDICVAYIDAIFHPV